MKIVYMGDSITDVGRSVGNGSHLAIGQGFVLITAAKLSRQNPGKFTFVNNGISGNRIVDIYARIKADLWNHEPDVLSLLIGVNDVTHEVYHNNGVEAERFETLYRMYIADTYKRFPNIKMIAMEPFVLKGSATESHWDAIRSGVELRAKAVKKAADEFGFAYIPLQTLFDQACEEAPVSCWSDDGLHPTIAGHQLIADAWLDAFYKWVL